MSVCNAVCWSVRLSTCACLKCCWMIRRMHTVSLISSYFFSSFVTLLPFSLVFSQLSLPLFPLLSYPFSSFFFPPIPSHLPSSLLPLLLCPLLISPPVASAHGITVRVAPYGVSLAARKCFPLLRPLFHPVPGPRFQSLQPRVCSPDPISV